MKWTELSAGTVDAAQQRLWTALGEGAEMVAARMIHNPVFLDRLVAFAHRPDIAVWQTIKLGRYHTSEEYRVALKDGDYRMGKWVQNALANAAFVPSQQEAFVDLVEVSVAELGLPDGTAYMHAVEQATELGLSLCHPEVGPVLRMTYVDQPRKEGLLVATEGITYSGWVDRLGRARVPEMFRSNRKNWCLKCS